MEKAAVLVLEDGFTLRGKVFAEGKEVCGEVVFNTGMTGYQEIITDPSYCEQIVVLTYPLIGNYGVNSRDNESAKPQIQALLVSEYCSNYSNWRAECSLKEFLENDDVLGVEGIDTRELTKHIRQDGAMKGALAVGDNPDLNLLRQKAEDYPSPVGRNLASRVTCKSSYKWNNKGKYHVLVIDYGVKRSILNQLVERNCKVTVASANISSDEIFKLNPDGILLSNGPGDPAGVTWSIKQIKNIIGKLPIFGICFGHQVLALALGIKTYKLKFGHHGGNHPVKNIDTGMVEITTQNHGFCVKYQDVKKFPGLEVTHINLNDDTLEGMFHQELNCFSVQFHPEAAPGPHDSSYLFQNFIEQIKKTQ